MREEEVDSIALVDRANDQLEQAADLARAAEALSIVFEKVFNDLYENLETNARNCDNSDATTALHDVAYAVSMLDIPFLIREALEVPHPVLKHMKRTKPC